MKLNPHISEMTCIRCHSTLPAALINGGFMYEQ